MEDDPEVAYVLVVNKAPVLLGLALLFAVLAYRCWDEFLSLAPTEQKED